VAGDLGVELARQLATQAEQLPVERVGLLRVELRAEERGQRLRVRHLLAREGGELLELAPSARARRLGDRGVDVVGEELERAPLEVLLAHEQERCAGREERDGGGEAERIRRQAVAERAVTDL